MPGSEQASRCEAFIIGQPLQELGSAISLAGASEVVLALSARHLLEGGGFPGISGGETRPGGCLALPLSGDAPRLADSPALRSHKDAAGGTPHGVALEGSFERVLAQLLDRPLQPGDDGSKQPSSFSSVLADRIRYMSKFVPEFVSQRLAATKDADMVAEHRHVSILFVIGSFQVRDALQGMAAPELIALCACT